jgi:hypothetical protein
MRSYYKLMFADRVCVCAWLSPRPPALRVRQSGRGSLAILVTLRGLDDRFP